MKDRDILIRPALCTRIVKQKKDNSQRRSIPTLWKFSSYKKTVRVMAWVVIATRRFAGSKSKEAITVETLKLAEVVLTAMSQPDAYEKTIEEMVKNGRVLMSNSLSRLAPFLQDVNGMKGLQIIRLGGRTSEAYLSDEAKYPMLVSAVSQCSFMGRETSHS